MLARVTLGCEIIQSATTHFICLREGPHRTHHHRSTAWQARTVMLYQKLSWKAVYITTSNCTDAFLLDLPTIGAHAASQGVCPRVGSGDAPSAQLRAHDWPREGEKPPSMALGRRFTNNGRTAATCSLPTMPDVLRAFILPAPPRYPKWRFLPTKPIIKVTKHYSRVIFWWGYALCFNTTATTIFSPVPKTSWKSIEVLSYGTQGKPVTLLLAESLGLRMVDKGLGKSL